MMSRKNLSDGAFPPLSMQPVVMPSECNKSVDRRLKWFRALPPVGASIPPSSILGGLWDSIRGKADCGHDTLPHRLTEMTGLQHWVFTNSGRAALSSVLMALHARRPECDEVIIPAYTSYSVPAAVVRAGLKIRLCDVETDTLGLDPRILLQSITSRTLCIVAHHLYGLPCRMAAVSEIARTRGLSLIEDAAQGMGITCEDQAGGTRGDAGIFSLSRGKLCLQPEEV